MLEKSPKLQASTCVVSSTAIPLRVVTTYTKLFQLLILKTTNLQLHHLPSLWCMFSVLHCEIKYSLGPLMSLWILLFPICHFDWRQLWRIILEIHKSQILTPFFKLQKRNLVFLEHAKETVLPWVSGHWSIYLRTAEMGTYRLQSWNCVWCFLPPDSATCELHGWKTVKNTQVRTPLTPIRVAELSHTTTDLLYGTSVLSTKMFSHYHFGTCGHAQSSYG